MKILALDASSRACSAALIEDGRVVAQRLRSLERGQAEALIPLVAEVLAEAGLACSGADTIACPVGPGSFTGLRIGLAAARGLALATGKPFAGVTSFEALAHAIPMEKRRGKTILAAVDAKRAELFVQYLDENLNPLGDAFQASPELVSIPPATIVVGDGAGLLKPHSPTADYFSDRPLEAAHAGLAVWDRLHKGRDVLPAIPLYLRPPDVTLSKKK